MLPSPVARLVAFVFLAMTVSLSAAPVLDTLKGTPEEDGKAVLSVNVTTGGLRTKVTIFYDTDQTKVNAPSPDNSVARVTEVIDGQSQAAVSKTVPKTGALTHSATYFIKAVAETSAGTATLNSSFVENLSPIAKGSNFHSAKAPNAANGVPQVVTIEVTTGAHPLATDPDGDTLTITGVAQPNPHFGDVAISGGTITYTPGSTFQGDDQFTYTVKDSNDATASAVVKIVNNPPKARNDQFAVRRSGAVLLDVLANDRDPDKDAFGLTDLTQPPGGQVRVVGTKLEFIPNASFTGVSSLTYTIADTYGASATATVTLFAPEVLTKGSTGVALKDSTGKTAGYLRIQGLYGGAFTGNLELGKKTFRVRGAFDASGVFAGFARDDNGVALPLTLRITLNADGTPNISAMFAGQFTSEQTLTTLTDAGREKMKGRYTVQLPSGASTTTVAADGVAADADTSTDTTTTDTSSTTTVTGGSVPDGIGWMTIKLDDQGNAGIKGQTGDGRKFGAKAVLAGSDDAPELIVFATPESAILTGTLKMGDTVSGDLEWSRPPTDATFYPDGFDLTVSAAGARWNKPESGVRALASDSSDSGRITITITSGDVTGFSHTVRLSESDKADVLNPGDDEINLKIHHKDGVFSGSFFSLDDENKHIRFQGVLVQGDTNDGGGVFQGHDKAGAVKIAVTTESDTTTTGNTTTGGTTTDTGTLDNTGNGLDLTGTDTGTGFLDLSGDGSQFF